MNKFSDLRATDIQLVLELLPRCDHGVPWVTVTINDQTVWDGSLAQPLRHKCVLPLLDPVTIGVALRHKQYMSAPGDTAVVVHSLALDGLELMPDHAHLAQYHNDHDHSTATCYLGFNGLWRLSIPEPFYQWWHRVTAQGWLLKPH
jgi:hypothetical protein